MLQQNVVSPVKAKSLVNEIEFLAALFTSTSKKVNMLLNLIVNIYDLEPQMNSN